MYIITFFVTIIINDLINSFLEFNLSIEGLEGLFKLLL